MKNIQAFPEIDFLIDRNQEGRTLLDYFAGQAMMAVIHNQNFTEGAEKVCWEVAKAMLKERENYNDLL